jgi:hypothetical protein
VKKSVGFVMAMLILKKLKGLVRGRSQQRSEEPTKAELSPKPSSSPAVVEDSYVLKRSYQASSRSDPGSEVTAQYMKPDNLLQAQPPILSLEKYASVQSSPRHPSTKSGCTNRGRSDGDRVWPVMQESRTLI